MRGDKQRGNSSKTFLNSQEKRYKGAKANKEITFFIVVENFGLLCSLENLDETVSTQIIFLQTPPWRPNLQSSTSTLTSTLPPTSPS